MEMHIEALEEGTLPPTLRQALISLVPKKRNDPVDCKNYHPISLMQLDAEVISKILANRLNRVVTSGIHPDQVGFICGRTSSDNIRRFINIMWKVAEVQSRSLLKILEAHGFGNTFMRWIQVLYYHPKTAVQTNRLICMLYGPVIGFRNFG